MKVSNPSSLEAAVELINTYIRQAEKERLVDNPVQNMGKFMKLSKGIELALSLFSSSKDKIRYDDINSPLEAHILVVEFDNLVLKSHQKIKDFSTMCACFDELEITSDNDKILLFFTMYDVYENKEKRPD